MDKLTTPTQLIERVYETILDAICEGTLKPNERITQEGLATTLGVSRQPILQAFQILKREGFIEESGRKGVAVTPLDAGKLVHLYQVRGALDALAARSAAKRFVIVSAKPFRATVEALLAEGRIAAGSNDTRALVRMDMAFHKLVYELSGNPVIVETSELHWHHIRRAMSSILQNDVRTFKGVWDEHEAIIEAILCGHEDEAASLAQRHAESAAEHLAKILHEPEHASKLSRA
ncbi:GntR family transcriptional regulator [Pseudomonas marginalis]|uniref:GntR family transcriptional regulator n=1 Tax=Pseudomonas TaxID=286 RepID=UPI0038998214